MRQDKCQQHGAREKAWRLQVQPPMVFLMHDYCSRHGRSSRHARKPIWAPCAQLQGQSSDSQHAGSPTTRAEVTPVHQVRIRHRAGCRMCWAGAPEAAAEGALKAVPAVQHCTALAGLGCTCQGCW